MDTAGPEFNTLLSGASHLVDAGHIKEAERIYFEAWALATTHGNSKEKELTKAALVEFLRARGRSQEADRISSPDVLRTSAPPPSALKDLVVIGSSAGGIEALCQVLSALPSDFKAAVLVVQQVPGHSPTELAQMLDQRSTLRVAIPAHGDVIAASRVYLAPPNQHLMVRDGTILLGKGPKENRSRPSIDALFRTAAHSYGPRAIAVILSGVLNDGTSGVMSIKTHGGKSVVQNPEEAVFDGMPRSAIALTHVDHIVNASQIGSLLEHMIAEKQNSEEGELESMPVYRDPADVGEIGGPGIRNVAPYPPSALTCPSCGGAVWEIQEQSLNLFKCHTGHSYTAELMLEEQSEAVDAAAWTLLRSINENIFLRQKLAAWARSTGREDEAAFHDQQILHAQKQSLAFRSLLLSNEQGRD